MMPFVFFVLCLSTFAGRRERGRSNPWRKNKKGLVSGTFELAQGFWCGEYGAMQRTCGCFAPPQNVGVSAIYARGALT